MKEYKREKYTLKKYNNEMYRMEITNEEVGISKTITSRNYEELYKKAKEEVKKGNHIEIWELKYEFIY